MEESSLYDELESLELDSIIEIIDEFNRHIYITRSAYEFSITFDDRWFYSNDVNEVIRIVKENSKGNIKVLLD